MKCDQKFLGAPIPEDTPEDERHPDVESITVHAEIMGEGTCKDGMGWKLRRLNSQAAAMEYGNPSGRVNGSNLCFTWGGDRENNFSEYRHDLLMLVRNDGTKAYFLHVQSRMYNDIQDNEVGRDTVLKAYPGSREAIAPLMLERFNFHLNRNELDDCEVVALHSNVVKPWNKTLKKVVSENFPAFLESYIQKEEWGKFYDMLDTLSSGAARKKALPALKKAMQMLIDGKLPEKDFGQLFRVACYAGPQEIFADMPAKTIKKLLGEGFSIGSSLSLKMFLIEPVLKAGSHLPQEVKSLAIDKTISYFNIAQLKNSTMWFTGGLKVIKGHEEFEVAVRKMYSHFKPEAQALIREHIGIQETGAIPRSSFDNGPR